MPSSLEVAGSDNSVVPSNDQIKKILIKSHNSRHQYVQQAHEQPSILHDCLELRNLIDRTPAIPSGRLLQRNGRTVYGQSTWKYKRQDGCNLEQFTNTLRPMTLGIIRPTICTTEGSSFRHWREQGVENAKAGNCLAILIFAWAYILSARLVELQGGSIRYTEVLAPIDDSKYGVQTTSRCVFVDIGKADSTAVRWWRAILAHGQGWRAAVHEYPAHFSPWSISYQGRQCLKVNLPPGTSVEDNIEQPCPSSSQAMRYLADFCDLHHLRSQSSAALAATLVLPLHNYLRQGAILPEIVLIQSHGTPLERLDFHEEDHALPYLMTLSCTARLLDSALWGVSLGGVLGTRS